MTQAELDDLHRELERRRRDACADPTNGWATGSHPLSVHRAAEALNEALDQVGPRAVLREIVEVWP